MDLGVGTPLEVNSVHHGKEHPLQSPNSGRKRKLQLEHLALPMPKHKCLHQHSSSCSSDRASPPSHRLVPDGSFEDSTDETETGQIEESSCKGSSRLLEGSDSTMELDLAGHVEMSPKIFVPSFEPSASTPSSPEGIGIVENNKDSDCQHLAFGADDGDGGSDRQLPVPAVDEGFDECMEEEFLNGPIEDLMLSCEDVGLNTLGLSSARWSIKQDAERPTIDQEFEQYFSMFML